MSKRCATAVTDRVGAEIRRVGLKILAIIQKEAPAMFSEHEVITLPDGTQVARTQDEKV